MELSKSSSELTGLPAPLREGKGQTSVAQVGAAWITDDLLRDTRRVWSKAYGRVITPAEAVEILMNVKRLAEAVLKAEE